MERRSYDADGRMVKQVPPEAYDADDRLTEERVVDRKNGIEVRYGYDALNRVSRIHYGNGVETAYDGDGNISSLETKLA